jgi:hypothetical protein
MPEPRLISSYLAILAAQLPASIVEELADGLTETHRSYLRRGLAPDAAARSAVAEFGEPQVIVAGFARVNPARRAARRLLGAGPAVGACWIAVLLTGRSWAVPLSARMLAAVTLAAVIALLATSALGKRYRLAARTGAAGFLGIIALDGSLIASVALAGLPLTWVLAVAMAASAARICYAARALRPALAG